MVWLNNKSKQIALCLVLSVSVVIPLSGAPKKYSATDRSNT